MDKTIKVALIGAGATILSGVIGVFGGKNLEQRKIENEINEVLGDNVNVIGDGNSVIINDVTSLAENYMKQIEENKELQAKNDSLVNQNLKYFEDIEVINGEKIEVEKEREELQRQLSEIPEFELRNPSLIMDGLKVERDIYRSILMFDGDNYYSQNVINLILNNKLSYNQDQNAIFYSINDNISSETKVDLFETDVLYGGKCYQIYKPSSGKSFAMASKSYNKGFTIYDDHSLFGEGDGYALFELDGKYSKISFDVGKVADNYKNEDVTLKVYIDEEFIKDYSLNAELPPESIEIDLNYAKSMKLEIVGGFKVIYGFSNVILHY